MKQNKFFKGAAFVGILLLCAFIGGQTNFMGLSPIERLLDSTAAVRQVELLYDYTVGNPLQEKVAKKFERLLVDELKKQRLMLRPGRYTNMHRSIVAYGRMPHAERSNLRPRSRRARKAIFPSAAETIFKSPLISRGIRLS